MDEIDSQILSFMMQFIVLLLAEYESRRLPREPHLFILVPPGKSMVDGDVAQ